MAVLKPSSLSPSSPHDATQDILFSWSNYGDRGYHSRLLILYAESNLTVFDSGKLYNLNTFYNLTANSVTNNATYKYTITIWNQTGDAATSDWMILKCSSIPNCQFTNVSDNQEILNSSYLFQGSYSQAEVPIKSWNMILYDNNDYIIGTTDIQYEEIIEYLFEGLNTDDDYSIELQVRSQDDLINTTGKVHFHVRYEVPSGAIALEAENISSQAAVRLQWRVIQIIGQAVAGTIQFIDNEKIDLLNGVVAFQEGVPKFYKFNLKLWIDWTNLKNDIITYQVDTCIGIINWDVKENSTEVLRLKSSLGDIWVKWIYDNDTSGKFHIYKNFYNNLYSIQSAQIAPITGNMVYLGIDFNGNLVDVYTNII